MTGLLNIDSISAAVLVPDRRRLQG